MANKSDYSALLTKLVQVSRRLSDEDESHADAHRRHIEEIMVKIRPHLERKHTKKASNVVSLP